VFIGVTTPLVWAATRPPPPQEDLLEDEDEAESSSEDEGSPPSASASNSRPASARPLSGTASIRIGPRASLLPVGMLGTGMLGNTQQQQPTQQQQQQPDPYTVAAALGALTDRDAARRAPGLTARDTHEVTSRLLPIAQECTIACAKLTLMRMHTITFIHKHVYKRLPATAQSYDIHACTLTGGTTPY